MKWVWVNSHYKLNEEPAFTRRRFLWIAWGLAWSLLGYEWSMMVWNYLNMHSNPIRQDSIISTDHLFRNESYCIYHLTDFHLCECWIFTKEKLINLVAKINIEIAESGFSKDKIIVFMTGDFVNNRGATDEDYFKEVIVELSKLQIKPEQVFFTTWNHDILSFEGSIIDSLVQLWFRHADWVVLDHHLPFTIIGSQDFCTRGLDYTSELLWTLKSNIDPSLFSFLLTHDPTALQYNLRELLNETNWLACFSGHTHHFFSGWNIISGYQTLKSVLARYKLKIWWVTWLIANRKFGSGYYRYNNDTHLFNTNGLWEHPRIVLGGTALGRDAPYTYRRVILRWIRSH